MKTIPSSVDGEAVGIQQGFRIDGAFKMWQFVERWMADLAIITHMGGREDC